MIDKNLLRLLGGSKKYIGFCVGWMVLGLFANVGITASLCWSIALALRFDGSTTVFAAPVVCACAGLAVRYLCTRLVGDLKDTLGAASKRICESASTTKLCGSVCAPPTI